MSERTEDLTDEAIRQFLRTRSSDPDLALLGGIMGTVGATPQDRPWFGLRPIVFPPRTVLIVALALLLATMGALAVGSFLLPRISGGMWPQTSLAEAQVAQQRADAGDPAYTWQLAPEILGGNPLNAEIVDRFIHEELGWEDYRFNPFVGWEQDDTNLIYVRCAPGETNPMYPDDDTFGQCAPTLDQFHYETVRIDLRQPIRTEPTGIWVVNRWATRTPFAQVDPSIVDARATARLEAFLDARVAGEGAEGHVQVNDAVEAVPLMYATSSGARFERYLIERVGVARWPYGNAGYTIRLFADGGATVVEQPVALRNGGLYLDASATTENGQPLVVSYSFFGGTVTFDAADPWKVRGGLSDWGALTMGDWWSTSGGIEVLACDPRVALVDAQALARSIQAYPGQVATAPVAGRVGAVDGLVVDVSSADLTVCGARFPSREVAVGGQGTSIRFYLLDLPEGLATRTLVIAIVAPEAGFEAMIEAAAPIIESIQFPAP